MFLTALSKTVPTEMRLEKDGRSIVGKIQMITLLLRKKKKIGAHLDQ